MTSETNIMEMMKECMKGCKVCSLIPITLGILAFLLGYFLDAEIVRILWLVFSGLIALFGIFIFLMINTLMR
jgi:hypothetical protein